MSSGRYAFTSKCSCVFVASICVYLKHMVWGKRTFHCGAPKDFTSFRVFILQPSLFLGGQVEPVQYNFKMNFVLCGTRAWMLAFIPHHFSRSLLCVPAVAVLTACRT